MRWRRPGLRAQFVIALLATSALTLVAAVATLVPPLEHRLATDRLRDMRELARTADLGLARLPRRDLRRGSARQDAVVRELARRMGGRVALFDAHGIELADTDPERREPRSATPERLVDAGFARAGDVRDQVSRGEAVVVAPVRTRAGRRTLVLRKSLNDSRAAVGGRARRAAGGRRRGASCSPRGSGSRWASGCCAAWSACAATRGGWPTRGSSSRWPSTPTATRWARWRSPWRRCARGCTPRSAAARPSSPPPRTSCARRWRRCAAPSNFWRRSSRAARRISGGFAGAPPQLVARPIG